MYANKSIANHVTFMGSSDDAERVWVMLHSNQGPYLIGAWYRAPCRADDEAIRNLAPELEKLGRHTLGAIVIGDMNVHHERWLGTQRARCLLLHSLLCHRDLSAGHRIFSVMDSERA